MDDYFFFLDSDYADYNTNRTIEGGVIPDIIIPPSLYPQLIVNFISKGTFFNFARHLIDLNWPITKNFHANQQVTRKFKNYLKKAEIQYDSEALKAHDKSIREEIEREVLSNKFSPEEGVKVFLKSDTVIQKAVEVLKKKHE